MDPEGKLVNLFSILIIVVVEIFTTDGLNISAKFAKLSGAFFAKLLKGTNVNKKVSINIFILSLTSMASLNKKTILIDKKCHKYVQKKKINSLFYLKRNRKTHFQVIKSL